MDLTLSKGIIKSIDPMLDSLGRQEYIVTFTQTVDGNTIEVTRPLEHYALLEGKGRVLDSICVSQGLVPQEAFDIMSDKKVTLLPEWLTSVNDAGGRTRLGFPERLYLLSFIYNYGSYALQHQLLANGLSYDMEDLRRCFGEFFVHQFFTEYDLTKANLKLPCLDYDLGLQAIIYNEAINYSIHIQGLQVPMGPLITEETLRNAQVEDNLGPLFKNLKLTMGEFYYREWIAPFIPTAERFVPLSDPSVAMPDLPMRSSSTSDEGLEAICGESRTRYLAFTSLTCLIVFSSKILVNPWLL
jgi:hypothetical protein